MLAFGVVVAVATGVPFGGGGGARGGADGFSGGGGVGECGGAGGFAPDVAARFAAFCAPDFAGGGGGGVAAARGVVC